MRRHGRALVLAVALVSLAFTFFSLRPAPHGGPPMRDFESYWAAGRAELAGLNPYGRDVWRYERTIPGVVATRDEVLPFVGPPYGLPVWSLIGRLPYDRAVWIWGALLGLSIVTIAVGSLLLSSRRPDILDVVASFVLCGCFGPLTSGTGLGQVAIFGTAAVIAAGLVAKRSGTLLALAALAASLQPNLAIALAALLGRRTALALAIAASAALLSTLVIRDGSLAGYLALLGEHGKAERFIAIQMTVAAVARGAGGSTALSLALGYATSVAVAGIALRQLLSRERSIPERLAIACAALPLALPFSHEHDLTIVFFPAVMALRSARSHAFGLAAAGTILVAIDWIGLAQRPTGIAFSAGLAVAASLALGVLARRENLVRLSTLAFVPLVLLVGGLTHALPTWPDALTTTYHAAGGWNVTQVWYDEQARSGIATFDPWWAALRALSLLGCAVVWYAVVRTSADERERVSYPLPDPGLPARPSSLASAPRSSPLSTPPRPAAEARP